MHTWWTGRLAGILAVAVPSANAAPGWWQRGEDLVDEVGRAVRDGAPEVRIGLIGVVLGILLVCAGVVRVRWQARRRRREAMARLREAPPPVRRLRQETISLRLDKYKNREAVPVPRPVPPEPPPRTGLRASERTYLPEPVDSPPAARIERGETLEDAPAMPTTPRGLDRSTLETLEWKRFELLVLRLLLAEGERAESTGVGLGGGPDLRVYALNGYDIAAAVVCRTWPVRTVDEGEVRELAGWMHRLGAPAGLLAITGSFTPEAAEAAAGAGIGLLDGAALLARFQRLPDALRQEILDEVLAGDFTTPTCRVCDTRMLWHEPTSRWNCPRAPRCAAPPLPPRDSPRH